MDIVAFVAKGDFPRSRLGEKQRGKILASWVTRKMETVAQFAIRGDTDETGSQITEVPEARSGRGSVRGGSSLRNVETVAPQITSSAAMASSAIPPGISEMPAREAYESSIVESPPLPDRSPDRDGNTPTIHNTAMGNDSSRPNEYFPTMHASTLHPAPSLQPTYTSEPDTPFLQDSFYDMSSTAPLNSHINTTNLPSGPQPSSSNYDPQSALTDASAAGTFDFGRSATPTPPPARYESKPSLSYSADEYTPHTLTQQQHHGAGDLRSLPSQQQHQQSRQASGGSHEGANRPPTGSSGSTIGEDWPQEALMHMNLGGHHAVGRNEGTQQHSSGYRGGMHYGSAL